MIKRLFHIARSNFTHWKNNDAQINASIEEEAFNSDNPSNKDKIPLSEWTPDSLAQYYANLEIPPGSSLEETRSAWKRMLKKYHPDLHSSNAGRRETAEELTRRLNEAYQTIEKELENKAHNF
tara:strand:- start:248 stop:616 length:369 start_codon:yes stop_codon:yes gene_type:complete